MSGNAAGAAKTREKNLAKDPNYYANIGRVGGSRTGVVKGFAANRELAREVGRVGGSISKRRPKEDK